MTDDDPGTTEQEEEDNRLALGVAFGAPIGVVLSLLLDNWALLGVGIALGLVWAVLPSGKDRRSR
ncbi:DUF4337 domain-containing protein [Nocardioides dongxiaopingii]|uniref:DUF4337 domain-containing protein n=1 Tax=Nocardioides sp. S-1144 TaxID=2582905 RepID=UPI00110D9BAC|nr:DUF4337 domain-containing protein [Nocardioides sp. S-1144]QCW52069.1 DUF4337 domain-containing protein [Nocardioides sp. S-1144]